MTGQERVSAAGSADDRHRYWLFGLRVESAIPLPDLYPAVDGPADVAISFGTVPDAGPDEPVGLHRTADGLILNIPEVGRYWIPDERRIVVQPAPETPERNVRLYLLGSAFGAILHLRRLLPLHANAVEVGTGAVAFLGHSGAGKSTIARWFYDQGHRLLSDDVCVVDFDAAGTPAVHYGIARLRLWRDALESSGRQPEDFEFSFDGMDKYDVPALSVVADPTVPLRAIYVLEVAEGDSAEPEIVPLTGAAAVEVLSTNTYRGQYLPMLDGQVAHFQQCIRLARTVPVFRIRRAWGHHLFDRQMDAVRQHFLALSA